MALKFVKQSASTLIDGKLVRLVKDDPWRDDDPIVVAAPEFFVDEPSKVQTSVARVSLSPVEQATAAPGEKRAPRRAAAKPKD